MQADVKMSVTVTLVFADERHREAWLIKNGFVPSAKAVAADHFEQAKRVDYEHRMRSQNLAYTVGPVSVEHGE